MKHLASNHVRMVLCLVSLALAGFGCGADAGGAQSDDAAPQIGEAAQAFTNGYYYDTWYAPEKKGTGLSPSEWTCFLAGVGGHIWSDVGDVWSSTQTAAYIGAANLGDGQWTEYFTNGGGGDTDIGGRIMCVPTPALIPIAHWASYSNGGAAIPLTPVSSNVVCGLVAVADAAEHASDNLWQVNGSSGLGSGDSAYTFQAMYNGQNYFYLGGSGNAEAYATCIDVSAVTFGPYSWHGQWTNKPMIQANIDTDQCFITGVGGRFDPSTSDPTNGSWVNYASSNLQWSLTVDDGKAMGVRCVE